MPKGTNQKLKLYRLAQIMLENTDDEHYITMPEIMEELGKYEVTADRKTIYADLRDGRKTEVDTISGFVVKASKKCNVPAPTHEIMVELVHALEGKTL